MSRYTIKYPVDERGRRVRCPHCKRSLEPVGSSSSAAATRDHPLPKCLGGKDGDVVWCCWTCNQLKKNMTPAEWKRFMDETPEWWKRPDHRRARLYVGCLRGNFTATPEREAV